MTTPVDTLARRMSIAVFKFASCDGCQLTLLDCEEELLDLARTVQIASFTEMSSAVIVGPYDLALVEGSITTPLDRQRIQEVRAAATRLVTIGACATAGGIQALRNFSEEGSYQRLVYAHPEYLDTLATSTPISDHVRVDFELHGCPIDRKQLLEVLAAALVGRSPRVESHAVCEQCKARGVVCLTVSRSLPCLGPVTRAGCGAICPAMQRGCFGCFGPAESPNVASLSAHLGAAGLPATDLARLYRTFNAWAPEFKAASAEASNEPG